MIQSFYITNPEGNTLQIHLKTSLDDHGIQVFNLTGLGSPKATVSGLSGPTYDGIGGYFVRTDARHLLLTLVVPRPGTIEEEAKATVYEYFPVKEEVKFRVITDATDAYTMAIVESVEMNQFAKVENAVISLYCPDPYFLDQVDTWEYAEYRAISKTITYEGTVPIGARIFVYCGNPYGPVSFTIENDREEQSMSWDDTVWGIGDRYHINTQVGSKQVYHWRADNNTWHEITHLVDPTSQWIKLYPGENVISITVTGTYQGNGASVPDDANLEIYLPLNEGNGGIALDLHEDRDAFEEGGTTGTKVGKYYYYARNFIPENTACLQTSDLYEDFTPIGDFTIGLWLKPDDLTGVQTIFSMYEVAANGIKIDTDGTGNIQFTIRRNSSDQSIWKPWGSVGVWRHVFAWYNAATDIMYLSLNNAAASSRTNTLYGGFASTLRIGARHGDVAYFDGKVESVFLYAAVLTAAERTYIYNGGRGFGYSAVSEKDEIMVNYRRHYQGV